MTNVDYTTPNPPRFRIEPGPWGERVVIPVRRDWVQMLFPPFWLLLWNLGAYAAWAGMFTPPEDGRKFLVIWPIGLFVGLVFFVWMTLRQLTGRAVLSFEQGQFIRRERLAFLRLEKRYDPLLVRGLRVEQVLLTEKERQGNFAPDTRPVATFEYGGERQEISPWLDEYEGQELVDWLAARLPRSALAQ